MLASHCILSGGRVALPTLPLPTAPGQKCPTILAKVKTEKSTGHKNWPVLFSVLDTYGVAATTGALIVMFSLNLESLNVRTV